jgi:CHAD domain-containing protein
MTGALLEPLADDVAAGARVFARLSRRERHRVRIHAKRLRYALDLLRFALPQKSTADYVDALAGLQDTLGELNDAAVARERLDGAAIRRAGRQVVKDWHDAVEPPLVAKAARELKALARRPRPWRSPV